VFSAFEIASGAVDLQEFPSDVTAVIGIKLVELARRVRIRPTAMASRFNSAAPAAEPLIAAIKNGKILAPLQLPDFNDGCHLVRGLTNLIASRDLKQQSNFGQWFASLNPHMHDSITEPVELQALQVLAAKSRDAHGTVQRRNIRIWRYLLAARTLSDRREFLKLSSA